MKCFAPQFVRQNENSVKSNTLRYLAFVSPNKRAGHKRAQKPVLWDGLYSGLDCLIRITHSGL